MQNETAEKFLSILHNRGEDSEANIYSHQIRYRTNCLTWHCLIKISFLYETQNPLILPSEKEVLGLYRVRERAGSGFIRVQENAATQNGSRPSLTHCCLSTCRGDRRECYSEGDGLEEEEEEEVGKDIEDVKKTMASTLQHSAFGWIREPKKKKKINGVFFFLNKPDKLLLCKSLLFA